MVHSTCENSKQIHLLNEEQIPAWGLFQAVRPVFVSEGCKWQAKNKHEELGLTEDARWLGGRNALDYFKDELRKLPVGDSEDDLECDSWDNCVSILLEVLVVLDSIVKDDVLLRLREEKQLPESSKNNDQVYDQPSKRFFLQKFLDSLSPWATSPAIESLPTEAFESPQPGSDESDEFPKLAALAKLVARGSYSGESYLEAEPPKEMFKLFTVLNTFNSCVKEAYKFQEVTTTDSELWHIPTNSWTKWEDDGPSKALDRLHYTLLAHVKRCKADRHEILLKMVGDRFEKMVFDAIVIPCGNHDRHQRVRFEPDHARAPDYSENLDFVHRLCRTIEELERAGSHFIPHFIFNYDEKDRFRYVKKEVESHSNTSIDTTLKSLQRDRKSQESSQSDSIQTEDKTIMELVLAQSLLHLMRKPWMGLKWCTESLKFLRNHNDNELLDVYHPYLTYLLRPEISSEKPLNWYAETMTAFAQLLLEIESGREVELDDSIRADTRKTGLFLYEEMNRRSHEFEVRAHVQPAIENCLKFHAVLAKHQSDVGNDIDSDLYVRKTIYETIIWNLEKSLATMEHQNGQENLFRMRNMKMTQHQVIARVLGEETSETPGSTTSTPAAISSQEANRVRQNLMQSIDNNRKMNKSVTMFDSDVSSESYSAVAEKFWKDHQEFYKKYIRLKGQTRKSDSRRIRVAILDTGVDMNDSFVLSQTEDIETDRWTRVRKEFEGKPRKDWPRKSTCHPIKKCRNFLVPNLGDTAIDQCGHGTATLGLLLRIAPDVDIYVAKIADDVKFDDTSAVAEAIKWAAVNEVDIINMSFGKKGQDDNIYRAINSIDLDKAILFAAASNGGTGVPHTYPASDYRVIAVHALSGNGDEGSMNPVTEGSQDAFGTLRYGIESTWQDEKRFLSGTSYSTPIAVGIVANFFEWVDSVAAKDSACDVTENEKSYWKSPNGIRDVLRKMSRRKYKLDFVLPWLLFDLDKDLSDSSIVSVLRQGLRHSPL